jgi:hypothetical protein
MTRTEGSGIRVHTARPRALQGFDDLKARCFSTDEGECWPLMLNSRNKQGHTLVWFNGARMTLGVFMCLQKTGKRPNLGKPWLPKCHDKQCANLAHWGPRTMGSLVKESRMHESPMRLARITAASRAHSAVTPELADEIRASSERTAILVERTGFHPSTIRRIRNGTTWGPVSVPNSVFNLAASLGVA